MQYAIIIGTLFLIALLLAFYIGTWGMKRTKKAGEPEKTRNREPCPLCGTRLHAGERIHSVVFGHNGDRLMHLWGCPHCYPARPAVRRLCPVCHRELPPDGYLIGRLFERPDKKHLHILGCTECRS